MEPLYRLDNTRFAVRREAFGSLLLCRRTFAVSAVAPLAAMALEICHQPTGRRDLVARLAASQDAEYVEVDDAVGAFLERMVESGVLVVNREERT